MQQVVKTRLGVAVGVVLAIIAAAVAMSVAPNTAHAATVGNCSSTVVAPNVVLNSAGNKVGRANGKVYCSNPGRTVQVNLQLWEADDTSPDDFITSLGSYPSPVSVAAYSTRSFSTAYVGCNYDSVGNDELYSKFRFRVYSNGIWSAWSSYNTSGYISTGC